ncbi:S8 family serine peptidase [Kribbella sp. NPDC048915]|uniref:S8 family serine peptidase n=1 Tax=Kribbella sp. NPDC048915 TaxID=3155148 RepID=UPI0033CBB57C
MAFLPVPLARLLRPALAGVLAPLALLLPAVNAPAAQAALRAAVDPGLTARLADGPSDFWVRFERQPELTAAARITDWTERGKAVVSALRSTAERDQGPVLKALRSAQAEYVSLYIDNSIYVRNGSRELAERLAAEPGVVALKTPTTYPLPKPAREQRAAATSGVEWGVAAVHADQAWERYGATGQGIVVGSIDTGAQYDHPALVSSYRGNNGDGTFTHDYNWYDPAGVCAVAEPCDEIGHGTHTIGTMVGDDRAGQRIGVAPGARWISAKGCEDYFCSDLSMALSAQWMLAPTELDGSNPDPAKRPNIINNSWGGPPGNPWYQEWVRQWVAAGIFPTFSAGNEGPGCSTAGSPGDYPESYAVGAVDENGAVASFSSRGNPLSGDVKPDIAAPGEMIRSAYPGNRYVFFSGTSMAAPHVSGAVAVLWSAAPELVGDVARTRGVLDRSARDHDDTSCGGTAADNHVYGEGLLDVLAAVGAAPRTGAGLLTGKVVDASGTPIAGASLAAPDSSTAKTDADGNYELYLDAGNHRVTVQAFGYGTQSYDATISAKTTTTKDFTLAVTPRATLSGLVRDGSGHGWPLYAKLTVDGVAGAWYTKPATGRYAIDLPIGVTHKLHVQPLYGGYTDSTVDVALDGDLVRDVAVPIDNRKCVAPGYGTDCAKIPGGLVQGTVKDANTGQPVNDAKVTGAGQTATTITTADDPGQPDGLYWLFVPTGSGKLRATMHGYQAQQKTVTVQTDWVKSVNFSLKAGRLTVKDSAIEATTRLGKSAKRKLTITNDGTAAATYSLADSRRGFDLQSADGVAGLRATSAPLRREPVRTEPGHTLSGVDVGNGSTAAATGEAPSRWWIPVSNYPTLISDNVAATHNGLVYSVGGVESGRASAAAYVYEPQKLSWRRLADMPEGRRKPASGFVDGKLYLVGGWGPKDTPSATTLIYDVATDRWRTGAANPKPWGAVGSAVLDGKVYSVGGCIDECQVATTDVTAYDVAHDRFEVLAPYPEPASWASCGGIDGKVYCAGGLGADDTGNGPPSTRHAYAYDPATNTWSRVADLPLDLWASSYAVAGGTLAVTGGIALDSTVRTNEAFSYNPRTDVWSPLPNTTNALYRGAAACGLFRVGGLLDARQVAYAEQLPGHDGCAESGTDAQWLSESITSGTLAPGQSVTVTLTMNSQELSQPGTYRAGLAVRGGTPYAVTSVDVALVAQAPPNWVRLSGTVTGKACDGTSSALAGAVVALDNRAGSWTLSTGPDGGYAVWLPGGGKVRVVVAANDFRPVSVDVALRPGKAVELPITLQRLHC